MSHHLDSPLAQQDPRLDISDMYLLRGRVGTVFVMNVNPMSGSGGFNPDAMYEFKIDTDGDAVEDITLRATFGHATEGAGQPCEFRWLDGEEARTRHVPGQLVGQGRVGERISGPDGLQLWSGPAGDPFFIEGGVVTAVAQAVAKAQPLDLSRYDPASATNLFAETNVHAIVIEMPDTMLSCEQIGVWGVTALATDDGGWRQINRCAQPLINTLFMGDRADDYNASQPSEDPARYGPLVSELVASAVEAMGTADDPAEYGRQAGDRLFPDLLRYRVGTHASFGFAEANGRGLTEPAPEVMFALALNTAVPMGLRSSAATGILRSDFPYLAPPLGKQ